MSLVDYSGGPVLAGRDKVATWGENAVYAAMFCLAVRAKYGEHRTVDSLDLREHDEVRELVVQGMLVTAEEVVKIEGRRSSVQAGGSC